ncbi:hypothetical protein KY317_00055, partial [Candidatus Woesearchaeota archaeon]|nr:hypothetical protein [Candidatus Woesearchaeota archaeon]
MFSSRIGKKKWHTPFKIVLPKEYSGKVFMIDAKGLAEQRKSTAFAYKNSLEQYVKLKKTPTWMTECDLLCLWSGDDWKSAKPDRYCMQLLVPSKLIPEQTRQEIIQEGAAMLENGDTDCALVLTEDLKYVSSDSLCQTSAEEFHILSRK